MKNRVRKRGQLVLSLLLSLSIFMQIGMTLPMAFAEGQSSADFAQTLDDEGLKSPRFTRSFIDLNSLIKIHQFAAEGRSLQQQEQDERFFTSLSARELGRSADEGAWLFAERQGEAIRWNLLYHAGARTRGERLRLRFYENGDFALPEMAEVFSLSNKVYSEREGQTAEQVQKKVWGLDAALDDLQVPFRTAESLGDAAAETNYSDLYLDQELGAKTYFLSFSTPIKNQDFLESLEGYDQTKEGTEERQVLAAEVDDWLAVLEQDVELTRLSLKTAEERGQTLGGTADPLADAGAETGEESSYQVQADWRKAKLLKELGISYAEQNSQPEVEPTKEASPEPTAKAEDQPRRRSRRALTHLSYELVEPQQFPVTGSRIHITNVELLSATDTQAQIRVTTKNDVYEASQTYHLLTVSGQFQSMEVAGASRIRAGVFRTDAVQTRTTPSSHVLTVNYSSGQEALINLNIENVRRAGTAPSTKYRGSVQTRIRIRPSGGQPSPEQGTVRVSLDNSTDFNLAQARLRLANSRGSYSETKTAASVVDFSAVPVGSYTVTVEGVNSPYRVQPLSRQITVQANQQSLASFSISKEVTPPTPATPTPTEAAVTGRSASVLVALQDAQTKQAVRQAGFRFRIKNPQGQYLVGSNGRVLEFVTNTTGRASATAVNASSGVYVVEPIAAPPGYRLPAPYRSNPIQVGAGSNSMSFTIGVQKGNSEVYDFEAYVRDKNSGEPVPGVQFRLQDVLGTDVLDKAGQPITVSSNAQGQTTDGQGAFLTMARVNPGKYQLALVVPDGYQAVQPIPLELQANTTKIGPVNVQLVRDSSLSQKWEVLLQNENGTPLAGQRLIFTKSNGQPVTSGGQPFRPNTELDGRVYVDRIAAGNYTVSFDGDGRYLPVEARAQIGQGSGTVKTVLTAKLRAGKSDLDIEMKDEQGRPAGGAGFRVLNNLGAQVAVGKTDLVTGVARIQDLPYGSYQVEFTGGNGLQLVNPASSPTRISLSPEQKSGKVSFTVKRQTLTVSDAGKLEIEGQVYSAQGQDKTVWNVKLSKHASAPSTAKRGARMEIRVPITELTMPSKPVLTMTIGQGQPQEVQTNGVWTREDGYYVFRDDRSSSEERTTEQVVYNYSFEALAVADTPQYSVKAKADIISSDPSELIPPVEGEKVLRAEDKKEIGRLGGSGEASLDLAVQELNWNYQGEVDVKMPGTVTFTMRLPEDSGSKPFDPRNLPRISFTDTSGKTRTDIEARGQLSEDGRSYTYTIPVGLAEHFHFQVKASSKVDAEQDTALFFMDTKAEFVPAGSKDVLLKAEQRITTPGALMPSEETVEQYSACEDGRHRVNLSGRFSDDGKSIIWEARMTNTSSKDGGATGILLSQYIYPLTMGLSVGDGLGPAEILQVTATGKSFPYVLNEDLQTVYDDGSEAGQSFELRADYSPYHYMRQVQNDAGASLRGKHYSYVSAYNSGHGALLKGNLYQKDSPDGEKYWWDPKSAGLSWLKAGVMSGPNFQRMARGEYALVRFRTPITDFSRLRQLGPDGQPLGYTLSVNSRAYAYGDWEDTYRSRPVCEMDTALTLREKKNIGNIKGVVLQKDGIGEVRASGEFIENGSKIRWTIQVSSQIDSVWNVKAKRSFRVNYSLVDSKNSPTGATGLGPIEKRNFQAHDVGEFLGSEPVQGEREGQLLIRRMNASEGLTYTFETPVLEAKEDYRLWIEAFYGEESSVGLGAEDPTKPLPDDESNEDYVILEGPILAVTLTKRWENVWTDAKKPEVVFQLKRTDFSGRTEDVASVRLQTPESSEQLNYVFRNEDATGRLLPRFDADGNRYTYFVTEEALEGYDSTIYGMDNANTLWRAINVKHDVIEEGKDKVTYTDNRGDGRYPDPWIENEYPDARNAEVVNREGGPLNSRKERYKVEYEDSIIGKSAHQTNVPGQFDVRLTVEGRGKHVSGATDIVFVVDNSYSMKNIWGVEAPASYETETKMYRVRKTLERLRDELLAVPGTRLGLVNFASLVDSNYKPTYKLRWEGSNTPQTVVLENAAVQKLTTVPGDFSKAIPRFARQSRPIPHNMNNGEYNLGAGGWDGETNIVAGLQRGVEVLYPEEERENWTRRQKILVLISDGAAVGSVKLRNYPLDTSKSLYDNLQLSSALRKSDDPLSNYFIVNNKYRLYGPLVYYTENGVRIDNHEVATTAVADYYKALHRDMEVFAFAVDPENSGWTDPDFNQDNLRSRGEAAAEVMERQLKSITTDPLNNYIQADSPEEFEERVDLLKNSLHSQSIVDGSVTDPMGEQIILADRFTAGRMDIASSPELADGDFYLEDNQGNYLTKDGSIRNNLPGNAVKLRVAMYDRTNRASEAKYHRANRLSPSLVEVTLDRNGQALEVPAYDRSTHRVNLGQMVPNYIEDPSGSYTDTTKGYGIYRFVLAEHLTRAEPEQQLSYRNGIDFRLVESLDDALNVMKDRNRRLVLLHNGDTGLPNKFFETKLGHNQYPKVMASRGEKNLLEGVQLVREGDTLRLLGLNLGSDEEVSLTYRIHLKTDDPAFYPDYWYPANKTTTLNPKPKEGDYLRYFPIPSVKGPKIPLEIEKQWVNSRGELLSAAELEKLLTHLQLKGIEASLYRYAAKTNAQGAPINESGTILAPGELPVKDPDSKKLMRRLRLDASNHWQLRNEDMPAYDNEGRLYLYEIKEETPEGLEAVFEKMGRSRYALTPYPSYSRNEGYALLSKSDLSLPVPLATGQNVELQILRQGQAVDQQAYTVGLGRHTEPEYPTRYLYPAYAGDRKLTLEIKAPENSPPLQDGDLLQLRITDSRSSTSQAEQQIYRFTLQKAQGNSYRLALVNGMEAPGTYPPTGGVGERPFLILGLMIMGISAGWAAWDGKRRRRTGPPLAA